MIPLCRNIKLLFLALALFAGFFLTVNLAYATPIAWVDDLYHFAKESFKLRKLMPFPDNAMQSSDDFYHYIRAASTKTDDLVRLMELVPKDKNILTMIQVCAERGQLPPSKILYFSRILQKVPDADEILKYALRSGDDFYRVVTPARLSASRILAENMKKIGRLKPAANYVAHHIIPFEAKKAEKARQIISNFGIDINDASNGAWLSDVYHQTLHTNKYYDEITERLSICTTKEEVRETLKQIQKMLENGTFPH